MGGNNGGAVNNALRSVVPAYGRTNLPADGIRRPLSQANKRDLYIYGIAQLSAAVDYTERTPDHDGAIDDGAAALLDGLAGQRDAALENRLSAAIDASADRIMNAIQDLGRDLGRENNALNAKFTNSLSVSWGEDDLQDIPTTSKAPDGQYRAKPTHPRRGLTSIQAVNGLSRDQATKWLEYYGLPATQDLPKDLRKLRIHLGISALRATSSAV